MDNKFEQAEMLPEEIEAIQLEDQLKDKSGPKAVIVILDDDEGKRMLAARDYRRATQKGDAHFAVSLKETGEGAQKLIESIRRSDQDMPTAIILVLDRNLAGSGIETRFRNGEEVANAIIDNAEENNWQPPFLVGNSDQGQFGLETKYPKQYIGEQGIGGQVIPRVIQRLKVLDESHTSPSGQ